MSTRHQRCSNTGHNRQRRHLDQCTSAHQLNAAANECFRNRKSAILCHNRSVFSFVRTLKTWSCSHLLLCALLLRRRPCSNDRYLLSTGPTAENPPHAAAAGQWDRQTDRRQRRRKNIWTDTVPLHRRCSAHNAGNTNKQMPACHEINSLQNARSVHFHDYA